MKRNQAITKTMVLLTIILMDFLTGMEFDLFVPSFTELQSHFHLTPFWVEAMLSANFIGYCISLFFVGSLADRYGRKPIIFLGLITFIIGSIICLIVPYYIFLAGRFLQGVGIAAPAILSFLIIADSYSIKKQQYWLAMLNSIMNISVGTAPVIGSYITLYFHWQGNFKVLLFLGIFVLTMTMIFIPNHKTSSHKASQEKQNISLQGYLPIFQSKPLLLLIISIVIQCTPYWIFVGMSPLLYMKDLGISLSHFGFYQGSLALIFAFGSFIYGLMLHRYEQKKMLQISTQIFILSLITIALVILFASTYPLFITLAIMIFDIGQIIPTTLLYPLCLNFIPTIKGRVSALIQGTRLVCTALALQVAGYFYEGSFKSVGIIISIFILFTIITQLYIVKNRELMVLTQKNGNDFSSN